MDSRQARKKAYRTYFVLGTWFSASSDRFNLRIVSSCLLMCAIRSRRSWCIATLAASFAACSTNGVSRSSSLRSRSSSSARTSSSLKLSKLFTSASASQSLSSWNPQQAPPCQPVSRTMRTPRPGRRETVHNWNIVYGSNRLACSLLHSLFQAVLFFLPTVHGRLPRIVHSILQGRLKPHVTFGSSPEVVRGTVLAPPDPQLSTAPAS